MGKSYTEKKLSSSLYRFYLSGQLRRTKKLEIETLDFLHEHNSCLVAVYPGGGKTITSLSILSKLKKRTLIIVNKIVLVEQWRDSIRRFLGIEPFYIKGKNSKIKNSPIYIINAINIPKHNLLDLDIGCVIIDECHLILTTVFSQGLFHLTPEYLIGLSQLYRSDGFNSF